MIVDPLQDMSITSQRYDVQREGYIYYSKNATTAWISAFFNGRDKPERPVAIPISMAKEVLSGLIPQDEWLTRFFPKQMSICQKAIDESRRRLLGF